MSNPYDMEQQHILMEGREREHVPSDTCWCKPVDVGDGIWVHNDAQEAGGELQH